MAVSLNDYATALAREAMLIWEHAMDPIIKDRAQSKWGQQKWLAQCRASVSQSMQTNMEADQTWDLYRLLAIVFRDTTIFFPANNDSRKELHR